MQTGSSCADLAATIAKNISEGMLELIDEN